MAADHDDLGPYRVLGTIGRGGNSAVVRAIDLRAGVSVALKVRPRSAEPRLARELAILHAVEHPRIVRAIEVGIADDRAYLALELVEGTTLRELADPRLVERVLAQLDEAIAHLHARGFVHGDLQPANVLVDDDGNLRLCDFGSAGRIGEVTPAGVASHASPDRCAGAPLAPRDDRFALARLALDGSRALVR